MAALHSKKVDDVHVLVSKGLEKDLMSVLDAQFTIENYDWTQKNLSAPKK